MGDKQSCSQAFVIFARFRLNREQKLLQHQTVSLLSVDYGGTQN